MSFIYIIFLEYDRRQTIESDFFILKPLFYFSQLPWVIISKYELHSCDIQYEQFICRHCKMNK